MALLSAIDFNITYKETSFMLNPIVKVTDTVGGGVSRIPLLSTDHLMWGISAANDLTLQPVDDNLSNLKYWGSNMFNNIPLTTINIAGTAFSMYLSALENSPVQAISNDNNIYLPITPYISGGLSIEVFYLSSNDPTSILITMTNHSETSAGARDGYAPVSGQLRGIWTYDNTTSGTNVYGVINYHTGMISVDVSNVKTNVFKSGLSSLYVRYSANFPLTRDTVSTYISAAYLNAYTLDDTKNYYINTSGAMLYLTAGEYIYQPMRIALQEKNYEYTTASLSAVYRQRDSYLNLNSLVSATQFWPYNVTLGRAIVLSASSPNLLAILPLSDINTHKFPISSWSGYIDNIQLTATGNTQASYTLNTYFPETSLAQRTTATYVFNYDPPISEDLKITVLSSNDTREILRVYRQVNTNDNIYFTSPLHSLVWTLCSTTLSNICTALTGIVGLDLNNTDDNYNGNRKWPFTNFLGTVAASTIALSSPEGLSGYEIVNGVDYIKMVYDIDPDNIYTLAVSYSGNPFTGSTSINDSHTFQVYSQPSSIAISALSFDNGPFTRSLTAKVMDDRGAGVYVPLHPLNKIIWNLVQPDNNVTALKLDGSSYDFVSYTDDTLILKIQTESFDLTSTFPMLCSFALKASAYDTYHTPITYLTNTTYNFTVDTFPSTTIFDSYLKLNFEDSKTTTQMWRLTSAAYVLSAEDVTTLNGTSVISGTRLINFGNGTTTNEQLTAITLNQPTTATFNISLLRSNVSASSWLSAHSIESNMILTFISKNIIADFVVFPTYVFAPAGVPVVNTLVDTVTTYGASGYDVGHNEIFVLSAYDNSATNTYIWSIDDNALSNNTSTVQYNRTTITPATGVTVKLEIYNDETGFNMPNTYKDDSTGVVTNYSNKKTTDDSSLMFQNIRMVEYETPTATINSYSNNLILPVNTVLTATNIVTFPTDTPVVEDIGISYWSLSTAKWEIQQTNTLFNSELTLGNDDSIAGVIKYGSILPLTLSVVRKSYSSIPNTIAPYDYGTQEKTTLASVNITYLASPELLFVPITRYGIVGQNIPFYNETTQTALLTGFYVNDGYHASSMFISGFGDFNTTYPSEGTFSINITGMMYDGNVYLYTIPDAITIVSAFQGFDPTVLRIFGATDLSLPSDFENTKIPPNEWITADNFNRSINLLRGNLDYLKGMTKFYALPPTDFYGWLGSITPLSADFKWYYTNLGDYQGLSASLSAISLSAVNDTVYRNDILYVADNNLVKVIDSSINATLLNTIYRKTIADNIGQAKSVGIDSTDRVYVLDKPNNRVLVYAPYSATSVDSNKFWFEWGTMGGPKAKYGFNTPNDLLVDKTDSVWIADTGNKAIKKYTRTGSWLQTFECPEIGGTTAENEGIISIAIDSAYNIHVLTKSNIFKYTDTGIFIGSYTFKNTNGETPQKVISMNTGGFLYICLQTSIIKVLESGAFAGEFADDNVGSNYTSIFQNTYGDIYISNTKNVLKYFDTNNIGRSSELAGDRYMWSQEETNVDSNEDIQDWVINLIIKRTWDNIELFRRSLMGKIEYVTNAQGNLEIDIVNYTPSEYEDMYLINKEDIYVGVNEIVSSDVFNRCINQLQNSLLKLMSHI